MNTINDLTRIVHRRLRPLDGEWVRDPKQMDIGVMLGVTTEFPTRHSDIDDTILDPSHPFWATYVRRVDSFTETEEEVRVALKMLRGDEIFEVRDDGDDGPGAYVHVNPLETESSTSIVDGVEITFEPVNKQGNLLLKVDAPTGVFQTTLHRV